MNRLAALAPALLFAAASAATVTIDNFTETESIVGFGGNNGYTSGNLASGTNRTLSVSPWNSGTATLGIGSGTLVSNSGSGHTARIDYSFAGSVNLLAGAASAADSTIGLYVSTTSSVDVPFTVWFFNNQNEASAYWDFTALANSSGLHSATLASISASFPWDAVDFIRIEYGTNVAGSVTLGGDGLGLRAAATPVPEPSTYGLALGGLALAGAALRRRRK